MAEITVLSVLAAFGVVYLMDRFCEWQDRRRLRKSDNHA